MNFIFTNKLKRLAIALMVIGVIGIVYGFITDSHKAWVSLLHSNFYFLAIALASTFFLSLQYVAEVGWSVMIKRILMAIGMYLPWACGFMLVIFIIGHHSIYDWTHHYFYNEFIEGTTTPNPQYDEIIAGKHGYLNMTFYLIRLVAYAAIWSGFAWLLRRESLREDIDGNISHFHKSTLYASIFLVLFAVTSSTGAWDIIMSIDVHWFSTLFGWYTFAGLFVSGMSVIALITIYLKKQGYLEHFNENHLHDIGKFMFAFSIFWTYLWFAQFFLIWYANIPEEVTYFMVRFDHYRWLFWTNFVVNFVIPFLSLMTRDAKRKINRVMIVACIIFIGHWIDVFLMVTPGTIGEHWCIGLNQIGTTLGFAGLFIWVVFSALAKAPLLPKHHPMLEESKHHNV